MSLVYLLKPAKEPLHLTVKLKGSKSYSNRALICAALAEGKSLLRNISISDDTNIIIEGLRAFGINITLDGETAIVEGGLSKIKPASGTIDVGHAGTCMRYLTALAAVVEGTDVVMCGSKRMHQRPISDLVDALESLGAEIEYLGEKNCPPLRVKGRKVSSRKSISLSGRISSQFFSALFLVSPLLEKGLEVEVEGEQVSKSYIDMTAECLKSFGSGLTNDDYKRYEIAENSVYNSLDYFVEGDASGASYIWGLAAVTKGTARIYNIPHNSLQGDSKFYEVLEKMNCRILKGSDDGADWIEVCGAESLTSCTVDMNSMPDTAQTLSCVAAFAEGETFITGLETLKVKETDRIEALKVELSKLNIKTETGNDFIKIFGGKPKSATIETYHDHRMAMSFSLIGACVPNIRILDPNVVSKSFPDYWSILEKAGILIVNEDS